MKEQSKTVGVGRPLCEKEQALVRELFGKGWNGNKIAAHIRRSKSAVSRVLSPLRETKAEKEQVETGFFMVEAKENWLL